MSELSEEVRAEAQKNKALELIQKHGLSPELAALAAQSEDPDAVAGLFLKELQRHGAKAVQTDFESRIAELETGETAALRRGNVAEASAYKRKAMQLRNEMRERQREEHTQAASNPQTDKQARAQALLEGLDATARKSLLDRWKETE